MGYGVHLLPIPNVNGHVGNVGNQKRDKESNRAARARISSRTDTGGNPFPRPCGDCNGVDAHDTEWEGIPATDGCENGLARQRASESAQVEACGSDGTLAAIEIMPACPPPAANVISEYKRQRPNISVRARRVNLRVGRFRYGRSSRGSYTVLEHLSRAQTETFVRVSFACAN